MVDQRSRRLRGDRDLNIRHCDREIQQNDEDALNERTAFSCLILYSTTRGCKSLKGPHSYKSIFEQSVTQSWKDFLHYCIQALISSKFVSQLVIRIEPPYISCSTKAITAHSWNIGKEANSGLYFRQRTVPTSAQVVIQVGKGNSKAFLYEKCNLWNSSRLSC